MPLNMPLTNLVSQKNARRLINNRTKDFCLIFNISFILDRAQPKLDFTIKIVEIC